MQTPENEHRALDLSVITTPDVEEALENLTGSLMNVAALKAMRKYIMDNTDIELVRQDSPIDPFQLQEDLEMQQTHLNGALDDALDTMSHIYLEAIEDHLDASRDEN
jgi:hypothetical protein